MASPPTDVTSDPIEIAWREGMRFATDLMTRIVVVGGREDSLERARALVRAHYTPPVNRRIIVTAEGWRHEEICSDAILPSVSCTFRVAVGSDWRVSHVMRALKLASVDKTNPLQWTVTYGPEEQAQPALPDVTRTLLSR